MSRSIEEQMADLRSAIAAQEELRATLGDAVVDATLVALREKLAALEAPSAQRPFAREAQIRKMLTVLFADVSGFTAMSEALDAEQVADVMNALWQRLDAVIVEHGGMIDKHIGDAVMALWGVEQAREDDPERAIRTAMRMQAELAAFRDENPIQLAMRIGVNTGPVLLGDVGLKGEFTAMGDTVNLANRLQQVAPVGAVLVSHDTYRHVRGVFEVLAQEPITFKGKAEPVQTYVVQRAKPRAFRMGTRGVEGIETHMVGRAAELQTLECAFREASQQARTRMVMITGDAGVGKSRLLYEFEHWLELLPEPVWYFKGRATPAMQAIPYGILRDMFAFRFDILESDNPVEVMAKFRAGMDSILDADRADLVGHWIGFDFREAGSQAVQNLLGSPSFGQLATAYLINYLRAVAGEPTVIFLEDVHWADNSSLDLIDRLAIDISGARLLVVCLGRPSLMERRPTWGQGRATWTRLDLKPLSRLDTSALVGEILQKADGVPASLRDLIVDGAEGNPFYVEELIKMLVEDGVIVCGEDKWQVALDRLTAVRVPPTLTELLQARLDSLPPKERELLQRASVVGRRFWDAAVAELAADEADRVRISLLLEAICSRELIFRRGRSAFRGADEYIFKHALLRDVTYDTVLLKLRRAYHAQVARWLEAHAGERILEYLSLIAGHYELASEPDKAAHYLLRSGDELSKVSAFRDALSAFERALAFLPERDLTGRAALQVKLGNTYRRMSDYPAATQHYEQGLALARQVRAWPEVVAALNGLGHIALDQGERDTADRYSKDSLALAREHNDRAGMAQAFRSLGYIGFHKGEYETAHRYAEESLSIYTELGDRQSMANVVNMMGGIAEMQGKYEEAGRYVEQALAISRDMGDRQGIATALGNLGYVAHWRGKYEEARRYYEEALVLHREIGGRLGATTVLVNLGQLLVGLNDREAASRYLGEALRESTAIEAVSMTLAALIGVADLRVKAGQDESAAELLGLVLSHPASSAEIDREAAPVLAVLRQRLSAEQLEAALGHGNALELQAAVAEILAEQAQ